MNSREEDRRSLQRMVDQALTTKRKTGKNPAFSAPYGTSTTSVKVEDVLTPEQLQAVYEQTRVDLWKAWAKTMGFDFDAGAKLYLPRGHHAMKSVPAALADMICENDFVLGPTFVNLDPFVLKPSEPLEP